MAAHHLNKGKATGNFAPFNKVTHSQFAIILDLMVGAKKAASKYAKIMGGNKLITREEMVYPKSKVSLLSTIRTKSVKTPKQQFYLRFKTVSLKIIY